MHNRRVNRVLRETSFRKPQPKPKTTLLGLPRKISVPSALRVLSQNWRKVTKEQGYSLKYKKQWHVCKERGKKRRIILSHCLGERERRNISERGINSLIMNILREESRMGRSKEKVILKQK